MYISESMAKQLRESVLRDALSADIMNGITKSPYGNTSMFMGGSGERFMERALMTQYEDAKKTLKNIGSIDSVKAKDIDGAFQELLLKCQKIESLNKNALEKLASNYVIDLFSIPDETVKIETKLVDKIEGGDDIAPVEPFDGDVDFSVRDVADLNGVDGQVAKRYFLNALNMGANSFNYSPEKMKDAPYMPLVASTNIGDTVFMSAEPMAKMSYYDKDSDKIVEQDKLSQHRENMAEQKKKDESKRNAMYSTNKEYFDVIIDSVKRSIKPDFSEKMIEKIRNMNVSDLKNLYNQAKVDIDDLMGKKDFYANTFSSYTNKHYDNYLIIFHKYD